MDKIDRDISGHIDPKTVEKQFVRKYKQLSHLWNPSHPDYNNKLKRNAGYDALLPILRRQWPEATRLHIRKKINTLRSCYRKMRRKVISSGSVDDDGNVVYSYEPHFWKYHALKFLDEEIDNDEDDTEAEYVEHDIEYVETGENESGMEDIDLSNIPTSPIYLEEEQFDEDIEDTKPFKRKDLEDTNHSYHEVYSYREEQVLEKEFNAIGANVACKLQRMSTEQRYRAEMLINKVLIKGLNERLTEATDLSQLRHVKLEGSNHNGKKDICRDSATTMSTDPNLDISDS